MFVKPAPGEPTVATWVFDAEVEDPTGSVAALGIDGNGGVSWVRDEPQALRIDHGIAIVPNQPWANTAGAGGIVSTEGGALVAGSGLVQPES